MNNQDTEKHTRCYCSHCNLYATVLVGGDTVPDKNAKSSETETYLLRAQAKDICLTKHPSRLSVRWVGSGTYKYEVNRQNYVLEPGRFLLVADGEYYNSSGDGQLESFCISFNRQILLDVLYGLGNSEEFLLDNPFDSESAPERAFLTNIYPQEIKFETIFKKLIAQSERSLKFYNTQFGQTVYEMIRAIIELQVQVNGEIKRIPSRKRSTREELYRRISRSRDYIRANAGPELKLKEIAAAAHLSPYHFLRSYKAAFNITPHQELLDVKLEKARRLLTERRDEFTLGRIAYESGFSDLSSFSKAFSKKFNLSPSRFVSPKNKIQN